MRREDEPESAIDTRTLDALIGELKDAHTRLGTELKRLEGAPRLSEAYHDTLIEIYVQLTLWECLAGDLKAEMDRITDQLPDD
jgi:bacterioferritin (cytochrome b1)